MPKIIENLQNNILDEARKIIDEKGAEALSMRNLANRLGIAPSTLYNYYESKEQLTGALLKRSWAEALAEIDRICGDFAARQRREQSKDRSSGRQKGEPQAEKDLAEMVTVLRNTIRPLLQQHISQETRKKDKSKFDVNATVFNPLEQRVQLILIKNGHDEADAKAMAPVLMKLLVTCMFDTELEFEEILETVRKLQSASREHKQKAGV